MGLLANVPNASVISGNMGLLQIQDMRFMNKAYYSVNIFILYFYFFILTLSVGFFSQRPHRFGDYHECGAIFTQRCLSSLHYVTAQDDGCEPGAL